MNLRSYIFYRLLKFFLVTAGVLNMLSLIKIVTETFSFLNIADIWSVLVLVLYPIPYINLNVIPIAMLIAAYMTVRQLSLNSEITAMKASGIPFTYILKPMCSLMAIVAAVQAVNVSYISPYFLHRFEEEKIKLGKDLFLSSLVPGSPNQFGDSMIYFSKMGQQLSLEDVLVVNQVHEEFKIIQADTLSVKASPENNKAVFQLNNGKLISGIPEQAKFEELSFKTMIVPSVLNEKVFDQIDVARFDPNQSKLEELIDRRKEELTINDMLYVVNSPETSPEDYINYLTAIYLFFYNVFTIFALPIAVVPAASENPRGGDKNYKIIFFLVIVMVNFYMLQLTTRSAETGGIHPASLFITPFIFMAFGLFFIRRKI